LERRLAGKRLTGRKLIGKGLNLEKRLNGNEVNRKEVDEGSRLIRKR
jgi:hypothetical protein